MIPASFDYKRAGSVEEAIALLEEHGMDAKLLAGGHSLVPAMKLRLNMPGILIDISRLEGLRYIREEEDGIAIGAAATHHDIARSKLLQEALPILPEAADLIGDVQVRNVGTIGGSIAHADPAADWPAVLLALGATIQVQGPKGKRSIPADEFFTGFYMTALQDNEIITGLVAPRRDASTGMAYRKFMQPASRFAIVGCAAVIKHQGKQLQDARVAFTGVSDGPFLDTGVAEALQGEKLSAKVIEAAADKAAGNADIMEDHFATVAYRRHLAKVFAKRALMAAAGL